MTINEIQLHTLFQKSETSVVSQKQDLKLYNCSGHVRMEAIVQVKIMLFEAIWQITEMIIICPCNYTHTDSDWNIYWHTHFYILS